MVIVRQDLERNTALGQHSLDFLKKIIDQGFRIPEPTAPPDRLPATISRKSLLNSAMGRWRIERDYQELKSELGLHP